MERRWLPPAMVALLIVVVVLGGYVTAGALSGGGDVARTVGGAVTVRPASGWVAVDDPGDPGTEARFTRGSATLDVFAGPAGGDARALAEVYVRGSLDPNSTRLTVPPPAGWVTVPLAGGLTGVRLGYIGVFDQSGVPIEGEVTAVITPGGAGVVFDGWAPQGQLRFGLDDVQAMIEGAVFA